MSLMVWKIKIKYLDDDDDRLCFIKKKISENFSEKKIKLSFFSFFWILLITLMPSDQDNDDAYDQVLSE